MNNKNEDTMVHQIEKNLSNNINENLFLTGRIFDNNKLAVNKGYTSELNDSTNEQDIKDYPLVSYDYINTVPTSLSRADYIRQAREACLRQLSNTQLYSRPYDVNYMETEAAAQEQQSNKKTNVWKLFRDSDKNVNSRLEDTPQEIAAFRLLIIRTVCAIVIFLSVFIIDKFEMNFGKLTHSMIQEYVTGNDTFQELEDIIVTWLK